MWRINEGEKAEEAGHGLMVQVKAEEAGHGAGESRRGRTCAGESRRGRSWCR